jgi:hypothetical protein
MFLAQPAVFLAAIPLSLAVIRITRVSDRDRTTLLLLTQTVDIPRLLLATLVEYGPLLSLFFILVVYIGLNRPTSALRIHPAVHALGPVLAVLIVASALLASIQDLILIAVYVALYSLFEFIDVRRERKTGVTGRRQDLTAVGFLILQIFIFIPNSVWLPAENIQVKTKPSVVGYILREDDRTTVVLVEGTRRVTTISTPEVLSREPCRLPGLQSRPLVSYIGRGGHPEAPACP